MLPLWVDMAPRYSARLTHSGALLPRSSTIVGRIGNEEYFEGKVVVLGGVKYKLFKTDLGSLVAEDGDTGIVFRQSGIGKWIIGVYGETLPREILENWIEYVAQFRY